MLDRPVRVRYAPSPTGEPHVGNIRTALFNWLYARHSGGTFVVRIEDTDRARTVPGALEAILEGLRWLGLDWDEGPEVNGPYAPYLQSERTLAGVYREAADQLIAVGAAYECYCPPERLEEVRMRMMREKKPPMYDRFCREPAQQAEMKAEYAGTTPVVRFKVPLEGGAQVVFDDYLRGEVSFDATTLDDFILLKSDGYPTYHLANVVDDHLMEISHVIRGDEWLPSTPRHVLIYRALGWDEGMPTFVHLPLILGPDRAKLSKRHGAASIIEHKNMGYLPETMTNFLALLGWAFDDKTELFTRDELVENFSLDRLGVTAAVFNVEKLDWMNGVYIRNLTPDDLAERLLPFLERPEASGGLPDGIARPIDRDYLGAIVPLVQERLKLLTEAPGLVDFFFLDDLAVDEKARKTLEAPEAIAALEAALMRLEGAPNWLHATLEELLRPLAEELGLKTGVFFGMLRAAVTGRMVSPPLFETMQALGRGRCRERILRAMHR